MLRWVFAIALLMLFALGGHAQPDPAAPDREKQGEVNRQPFLMNPEGQAILVTDNGLYVMNAGCLARLNATTLETLGAVELFGPLPEAPAFDGPNIQRGAIERWQQTMQQRMSPATLVAQDDDHLLVVVGDQCFRVHQRSLVIESQVSLAITPDEREPGEEPFYMPRTKIEGDLVYIIRGIRLFVVDTAKGELVAKARLPKELTPRYPEPKPGKAPDAAPPREVTIVGTLLRHTVKDTDLITLQDDQGHEYLLGEKQRDELMRAVKKPEITVRVTGLLTPYDGPHQFIMGRLDIVKYQVLPE